MIKPDPHLRGKPLAKYQILKEKFCVKNQIYKKYDSEINMISFK